GREAAGQPRHGVEIAGDLRVGRVEGAVIVAVVVERRCPAGLVVRGVERDRAHRAVAFRDVAGVDQRLGIDVGATRVGLTGLVGRNADRAHRVHGDRVVDGVRRPGIGRHGAEVQVVGARGVAGRHAHHRAYHARAERGDGAGIGYGRTAARAV